MRITIPTMDQETNIVYSAQFDILSDNDVAKLCSFYELEKKPATILELKEMCKGFIHSRSMKHHICGTPVWEDEISFFGYKGILINFKRTDDGFLLTTSYGGVETLTKFKLDEDRTSSSIYQEKNQNSKLYGCIMMYQTSLHNGLKKFVAWNAHHLGVPYSEIEEFSPLWVNRKIQIGTREAAILISHTDCMSEISFKDNVGEDSNQTIIGLGHECGRWEKNMPVIKFTDIYVPMNIHISMAVADWSGNKILKKANEAGEILNEKLKYDPTTPEQFWIDLGNLLNGDEEISDDPKAVNFK